MSSASLISTTKKPIFFTKRLSVSCVPHPSRQNKMKAKSYRWGTTMLGSTRWHKSSTHIYYHLIRGRLALERALISLCFTSRMTPKLPSSSVNMTDLQAGNRVTTWIRGNLKISFCVKMACPWRSMWHGFPGNHSANEYMMLNFILCIYDTIRFGCSQLSESKNFKSIQV